MPTHDIKSIITDYIVENYIFDHDYILNPDSSFMAEGFMDSVGVFELVTFIESRFDIKFEDVDFVPKNLDSVNGLIQCISNKRTSKKICAYLEAV